MSVSIEVDFRCEACAPTHFDATATTQPAVQTLTVVGGSHMCPSQQRVMSTMLVKKVSVGASTMSILFQVELAIVHP
eukprot:CAMPEP_0118814272 /NCGR_PEP_ID=MMETSP1162-20130426/3458_1 /TAXON_ID=33656 /ORGANISM="Phaeocystis Sp, Strain CCMP2710" /LENGTH=76 /DNA_ID=CAMNT_0006744139 /DNA_START=137 /DNA_END=367 /DNA_ORIENTATION=-